MTYTHNKKMADVPQRSSQPGEDVPKEKTKAEIKKAKLAEKKRQKVENQKLNAKQQLRNHLARELKYTALSYDKAGTEWEEMMVKIKQSEFKQDIQVCFIFLMLNLLKK